jgi:hypothetical protein
VLPAGLVLEWFAKATRTFTPICQRDQRAVLARQFLRNTHHGRATAYDRLHKYREAVKDDGQSAFQTSRSLKSHHVHAELLAMGKLTGA